MCRTLVMILFSLPVLSRRRPVNAQQKKVRHKSLLTGMAAYIKEEVLIAGNCEAPGALLPSYMYLYTTPFRTGTIRNVNLYLKTRRRFFGGFFVFLFRIYWQREKPRMTKRSYPSGSSGRCVVWGAIVFLLLPLPIRQPFENLFPFHIVGFFLFFSSCYWPWEASYFPLQFAPCLFGRGLFSFVSIQK